MDIENDIRLPSETIVWELSCDRQAALSLLASAIDKPKCTYSPSRYTQGSWYQGIVSHSHFIIWTKQPVRGPTLAKLHGHVTDKDNSSSLTFSVEAPALYRIVPFNRHRFTAAMFIHLMIAPFIVLSVALQNIAFLFPIIFVVMIVIVFGMFNFLAKHEAEELQQFLERTFREYRLQPDSEKGP